MTNDAGNERSPKAVETSTASVAPVLAFLAVNRVGGLRWAVAAATAISVAIAVDRRRKGLPLGKFMPIVTAAVVLRGFAGVLTGSETVYFGLGIAAKYAGGIVLLGSALIQRPLAERAAPLLINVPPQLSTHRSFRPTMAIVTAIAGLYYLVSASFDVWLFRRSSVEGFVFVRFIANWPLGAVAFLAILAVLQLRLAKIPGVPPLTTLLEQRLNHTIESNEP